ncbi:MAG: hypothetical protein ABSC37_18400, partial [Xanthobacteraceae bacterium]
QAIHKIERKRGRRRSGQDIHSATFILSAELSVNVPQVFHRICQTFPAIYQQRRRASAALVGGLSCAVRCGTQQAA